MQTPYALWILPVFQQVWQDPSVQFFLVFDINHVNRIGRAENIVVVHVEPEAVDVVVFFLLVPLFVVFGTFIPIDLRES
jgi:hypothetical protein